MKISILVHGANTASTDAKARMQPSSEEIGKHPPRAKKCVTQKKDNNLIGLYVIESKLQKVLK